MVPAWAEQFHGPPEAIEFPDESYIVASTVETPSASQSKVLVTEGSEASLIVVAPIHSTLKTIEPASEDELSELVQAEVKKRREMKSAQYKNAVNFSRFNLNGFFISALISF